MQENSSKRLVIGIGLTGIDYSSIGRFSSRESQTKAFKRHFSLANKHNLPLVMCCRDD
jgi:Tat protein secretion system quality control protein TatD with DNase activity